MAPEEAAENYLYDFIYLNHDALAFYNAQLDGDGMLTSSVVTHSTGEKMKQNIGGSVKIVQGSHEESSHYGSSRQNSFDTSKSLPLNVMREMNRRSLIQSDIESAQVGQAVLFSGRMQIVDLALISGILQPALQTELDKMPEQTAAQKRARQKKAAENEALVKMFQSLPELLQIRLFDDEKSAWCTVRHADMMVDSFSLAMKHGVTVRGEWHVLAVLDALPEDSELDMKAFEYMTDVDNGYFTALLHLRGMMGRRFNEYGITPLAVFRKLV